MTNEEYEFLKDQLEKIGQEIAKILERLEKLEKA